MPCAICDAPPTGTSFYCSPHKQQFSSSPEWARVLALDELDQARIDTAHADFRDRVQAEERNGVGTGGADAPLCLTAPLVPMTPVPPTPSHNPPLYPPRISQWVPRNLDLYGEGEANDD